jgi:hypothetical protein
MPLGWINSVWLNTPEAIIFGIIWLVFCAVVLWVVSRDN